VKPSYVVPTMADVRAVEPCGFSLVSTFSGAGGSCLGFRLAGFDVLAASEFIESARDTYAANFPLTPVEPRDVRAVTGADLLSLAGSTDVDVLEGSPPCAPFSLAGQRDRLWGQEKAYSETRQRVDDLFDEYLRLVGELRPKVFVAENVAGLSIGIAARAVLGPILRRATKLGYVVRAAKLDANHFGVPQRRVRLIIIGARRDLDVVPSFPPPLPFRYTLRDALAGTPHEHLLGEIRYGHHQPFHDTQMTLAKIVNPDEAFPTILGTTWQQFAVGTYDERARIPIDAVRRIASFPPDFTLTGRYQRQWERIGRAVPPLFMRSVAEHVRDAILRPVFGERVA
jgi:DNA (cytosine-5)-methyltransferase 1